MKLGRMKIGMRLTAGFAIVIAFLVATAATGLVSLRDFNGVVTDFSASRVPKIIASGSFVNGLLQTAQQMRDVLLLDDEKLIKASLADIEKGKTRRLELLARIKGFVSDARERELFAAIEQASSKYGPHEEEFLKIANRADLSTAKDVMLDKVRPAQLAFIGAISAFSDYEVQASAREATAAGGSYRTALAVMLGLAGVALIVAIAVAWAITRSLTRQLGGEPGYASDVAKRIAGGDLATAVDIAPNDRSSMLAAIKAMQQELTRIVVGIKSSSDTIVAATRQIATGNSDLSRRTEQQAASLEETASSMEQLTGTVKQNAESARQANQLAAGASAVAVKGGEVVGEVVHTMSSINESSKKIADIIGVIDGIAFQTNILALNAAVEAARAGEQGRGFAVVASEVRSLAQRSAAAAKEIKALITDSVSKVDSGSRLVDEAGQTMEQIVAAVKRVTDIMSEIAAASQEQTSGIEQVNHAIMQMDQVTQQNAAVVEEAAAAAESMQEEAQSLTRAVSIFKLEARGVSTSAPGREEPNAAFVERRGPNRANNIARLPSGKSTPKTQGEEATAEPESALAPPEAGREPSADSDGTEADRKPRKLGMAAARQDDWQEF